MACGEIHVMHYECKFFCENTGLTCHQNRMFGFKNTGLDLEITDCT